MLREGETPPEVFEKSLFENQNLNPSVLVSSFLGVVLGHRDRTSEAYNLHPVERDLVLFVEVLHDGLGPLLAERLVPGLTPGLVGMSLNLQVESPIEGDQILNKLIQGGLGLW